MRNPRVFLLMVFCLTILSYVQAQTVASSGAPSANEFTAYKPYTGQYGYGLNPGWYYYVAPNGAWISNWGTQHLIDLGSGNEAKGVKGVGAKTYRMKVTDEYLSLYGANSLVPDYQYLQNIGAREIAAFVGEPSDANRLDTLFPGATEKSKVFKGMYEPIWLDAAQTQINPANTYANYLYNAVKTYGDYITFWEIVNEPDFTYGSGGWLGDMNPPAAGSWFDSDPIPGDLVNLQAPIQYYIRLLRISWEVIKKLQPNDYICTGGIGNRSFLAALLRNTDNPDGGKVTSAFPLKAGAYFDVLSFHTYPEFSWDVKHWDNSIGGQLYNRHSDAAVSGHLRYKNNMDSLLRLNGYNDVKYPAKQFICTETGMSRVMDNDNIGSNEIQRNYMIKAHVKTQMDGQIKQTYWFQTADGTTAPDHWGLFGCYYYFGDKMPYNAAPTDQGIALKTTSDLLYGSTYDATRTVALGLPSNVDGGAFKKADGRYVYVLWAKTSTDLSETAAAFYSFPAAAIGSGSVLKKEWNFSQTNSSSTISSSNLQLSGTPAFFEEGAPIAGKAPVANAGADQTITLPINTVTLKGSGSDSDGMVVSYIWTKVSGPAGSSFTSDSSATTTVNGLVPGTYTFRLIVTDNQGATGSDDVIITVKPSPTDSVSIKIEAENYTNMSGVQTETTYDAGGGKNVGWIDQGDWMEYTVDVPVAGVYTVNLRVATPNNGAQFQIRNTSGAVLSTVTVPNTGSYQTWQTTTTTIQLSAGQQTIRLQSSAQPGWNINWLEIKGGGMKAPNQAPVAKAGSGQFITLPVNSVTLNGSGSDSDGSIVRYIWTKISGPEQYTITDSSNAQTTVTRLVQGVYSFRLEVTDNQGASSADTVQVAVAAALPPPNKLPVANAGADQTITLPVDSVQLNGTGTDADGTISSYLWTKINGPQQYNIRSANQSSTAVTHLQEGSYQFELKVTDNQGGVAKDTLTVIVNPAPNQPPVANAGTDITITLPVNTVLLAGSATDADGSIVSYQWSRISGPSSYTFIAPTSASTRVDGLVEGVYTFRLTVTDNKGATASDDVQVTVHAPAPLPNVAPVADAGQDITITLPTNKVQLSGKGTDADDTVVSYQWSKLGGPDTYQIASPASAITNVTGLVAGTYTFKLTVTDNKGASGTDTVTVTVVTKATRSKTTALLYPVPATSSINLEIDGSTDKGNSTIRIFNTAGTMVYQEAFVRTSHHTIRTINISQLQKGSYFLSVDADLNTDIGLKFVKQ